MENHEAIVGSPKETGSEFQDFLNRIFRCRHRRKTYPFTPRGEDKSYAVCLDCGQRVASDLQLLEVPSKGPSAPTEAPVPTAAKEPPVPVAVKEPLVPAAAKEPPAPVAVKEPPVPVAAKEPPAPVAAKEAPIRVVAKEALIRAAAKEAPVPVKAPIRVRMTEPEVKSPPRAQAAAINSTVLFQELRNWKYDLLFVGLFVVGLSGGLLMVGKIRQRPDLPAGLERPPVPIACAEPKHDAPGEAAQTAFLKASAAMPVIPDVPKLDDASPKDRLASAPEENTGSRQILRLDSKSSVVVLGLEAAAVVELSEYPRRLGELIQNGSLFTVPSGTPIQIRERGRGIMKVEILEGAMAGRDGWTRSSHVTSRH